ncbi:tetratricopeptide repeat-containing sensor histidine kinase [Thermoflexibacter ruber]|uniref:tetratricopeptide repeat-containing sensor histidine kinase n=1 Tax=Thermoflexibacter ruber TaxID=1003 RepID=UPI0015A59A37|nr:tetratricopeptide repeat protein [Thermoflexibacter ruber]
MDSLQALLEKKQLSDSLHLEILSSLLQNCQHTSANCLQFIQKGLTLAQKNHNLLKEAEFLAHWGSLNLTIGDYPKSIEYTLQALKIDEELGNQTGISRDLNNLGVVYSAKGEIDKALKYYEQSFKIDHFINDNSKLSITLNNIGVIYYQKKQLSKALDYFWKGLIEAEKQQDKHRVGVSLNNIGDVYYDIGEYQKSNLFQYQALKVEQEIQDYEGIAYSYNALAKTYTELSKFDSAEYFAQKALEFNKKFGFNPQVKDNLQTLKELFYKKGDFKKAFLYADSALTMMDSLFSEDKNKIINQLQQKFELDKKQSEIESLQKDNIIKQQEIENQNLWRNIWIFSLGVTLAFIAVLFYSNYQRKKINDRLNAKNEALKNLNATKDKLFSIISHDLRSPFNTLKSTLELMKENAFSPKEIELVSKQMQKNIESISYTLDNLLQWSLSQMKGGNTNIEKVELGEIITETINFYQEVAKQKALQIVNQIDSPMFVLADKNQLRLILRNLLNNAIKFSFIKGSISFSYIINGKEVEIAVSDTGIGMTEEQLKNLFSPANRSTPGTSGEKGTGLGLLLCKEFVENNGGKINVQSTLYKGTTIVFSLKLA